MKQIGKFLSKYSPLFLLFGLSITLFSLIPLSYMKDTEGSVPLNLIILSVMPIIIGGFIAIQFGLNEKYDPSLRDLGSVKV